TRVSCAPAIAVHCAHTTPCPTWGSVVPRMPRRATVTDEPMPVSCARDSRRPPARPAVVRDYFMNTRLLIATCALSALTGLEAAEPGPLPCCPAPAAEPACCKVEQPAATPCCVG